jgi:hypothetical protein
MMDKTWTSCPNLAVHATLDPIDILKEIANE